ncbi:CpsD/CapB family tyrosine-protein kinase [Sphingobium sufflavum]|uniref:CpsD/CapB family tyrosine-protein kinase n=1 Tax=Sphingobium sufflavum TaxID=1129547 RepID=UPI001F36476F|nr:CpsD/CapB family tyrosine-protein kinase [Sphingobium sufflavum]MCE7797385.1 CpsD/CapB family tyrosine-protein kinase [Sphingobium sufflavum]
MSREKTMADFKGATRTEGPSLIERAAEIYDFKTALRHGPAAAVAAPVVVPVAAAVTAPVAEAKPMAAAAVAPAAVAAPAPIAPVARTAPNPDAEYHALDRAALREEGFVDPTGAPTSLSEEFRIVKRQLLGGVFAPDAAPRDRLVLVNSAHPGDGKTWLTINLALSLSAEQDSEVLLIDGDFGNPALARRLGLPDGPGFMDALADPSVDVADLIVRTDVPNLSILRAGRQLHNDTEILASDRTRAVLDSLVAGHPRRIVLFDSPPALAASAASELARHVGMVLLVVRADRTSDVALRDAVQLLSACPNIRAVLNGVKFSSSGRLFGAYYGKRS